MIPDAIKGAFAKSFMKRMLDGDNGSTLLGAIAAALLASNTDFGHLMHGLKSNEDAEMWAKVVAVIVLAAWGYYTGKNKQKSIDKKGGDPIQ